MAKKAGFPQNFYIGGQDISGDVGSIDSAAFKRNLGPLTGIDKSAEERIALLGDGSLSWKGWFNDAADDAWHAALKTIADGNVRVAWALGLTIGDQACFLEAVRFNYDLSRGEDGSLTVSAEAQGSGGVCLEWGVLLTPGKITKTANFDGASVDNGASSASGMVGFFQVFDNTPDAGTASLAVQDSPDNAIFTSRITFSPGADNKTQRDVFNGTVQRYVHATLTVGTSTSVTYAVGFRRRQSTDFDAL